MSHVSPEVLRVWVRHDVELDAAVLDQAVHTQQVRGRLLDQLLFSVQRQIGEWQLRLRAVTPLSGTISPWLCVTLFKSSTPYF